MHFQGVQFDKSTNKLGSLLLLHVRFIPGQEIAGASFGGVVTAKRRRRDVIARRTTKKEIIELFPGRMFGKKEVTNLEKATDSKSSIRARVKISVLNTFTLCFWIRTKDEVGQIFAIIYNNSKSKARIDVSIRRGKLVLRLDGIQR